MLNKKIRKKIGLEKYLNPSHEFIDTPEHCKKISIDVGLSDTAPHTGIWLANDPERCVVGIEPLEHHWEGLRGERDYSCIDESSRWPVVRLNKNSVIFNNEEICQITNPSAPGASHKFFGLSCAIDNISKPAQKKFYHMYEPGTSSLLKPTDKHSSAIKKIETVQCVSLQDILDYIDWEKFKVIEHLKVDCEGNDFEVLKSVGKYLEKIIFITCEASAHNVGHWHQQADRLDIFHWMKDKGFGCFSHDGGDAIFINEKISRTFGRPKGMGWIENMGLPRGMLVVLPTDPFVYYSEPIFRATLKKRDDP